MFTETRNAWKLCLKSFKMLAQQPKCLLALAINIFIALCLGVILLHNVFGVVLYSTTYSPKQVNMWDVFNLLLFYFLLHVINDFFNTFTMQCAEMQNRGEKIDFNSIIKNVFLIIPNLIKWTIIYSFSIFYTLFEGWADRWDEYGWVKKYLHALPWSMARFLVPVYLALENLTPFKALSRSSETIFTHWGQKARVTGGFRMVSLIVKLIALIPLLTGFIIGNHTAIVILTAISGSLFIIIYFAFNFIYSVITTGIYHYVELNHPPKNFTQADILSIIKTKKV